MDIRALLDGMEGHKVFITSSFISNLFLNLRALVNEEIRGSIVPFGKNPLNEFPPPHVIHGCKGHHLY